MNNSSVNGSWDSSSGNSNFDYEVIAPSSGSSPSSIVSVGFNSIFNFFGTLSTFSYDYLFNGSRDSLSDLLRVSAQFDFRYRDSSNQWVVAYNDFVPSPTGSLFMFEEATGLNLDVSGTREFDFSSHGAQSWVVEISFDSQGQDTIGQTSIDPVPEPATILLFGIGLIGLAGISRKRKP
ncbi:MAG: PEP-CTERM sorting domain-containing protein [Desulfobacteraceae bacterium]|nr:PEP-CTERM sorting domain-containing protein [Desulfobacteraceae bacterium]